MWQGIQGHDEIVERFRRTMAAGRLASTYLFVGPEGVGKRKFALKLAQALLCTESDEAALEPCGSCQACVLCGAGSHPDLHIVGCRPGKKYLLIEQFVGDRDHRGQEGLCHDLALRPMLGRRRVAIIDDADWFNQDSANCLLKILEEPPPDAVIILIGTSRSRQLPTILSRAQLVRFDPLPAMTVQELALAEGLATDAAAAAQLADESQGSLARARDLADPTLDEMRGRVIAAWQSGDVDIGSLAPEIEDFISAVGKEAEARRARFRQLLALVAESLRASLRLQVSSAEAADVTLAAIDRCLEAEEQLDRNANQATLLETWLDDLAALAAAKSGGAPIAVSPLPRGK
jgi:DNA polymerase-3 subunit delta'